MGRSFFFHFVNSNYGVDWYIGSTNTAELGFQLFLAWIDNQFGLFTKDDIPHFKESKHVTLRDMSGIEFVHFRLVVENDSIHLFCLYWHVVDSSSLVFANSFHWLKRCS